MMWYNGNSPAEWVVGHIHGANLLKDSHPSPDYLFGQVQFQNGVRGILECGDLAPGQIDQSTPTYIFWHDNAVTLYGTHGYAKVMTGGGWKAFTKVSGREMLIGEGMYDPEYEQPLYLRELADWLDDSARIHPCNGEVTYRGFEALYGMYLSSLEHSIVKLPLDGLTLYPIIGKMHEVLGEKKIVETI
jgi:predicted dehydrogenase